jgi:hypothetical protein
MDMHEQPTCGKGLAENSVLPARLGDVIGAMANNLEAHRKALDLTDENSRLESEAYERLLKELRQAAAQLQETAQVMTGYRDLPMGRHDEQAMTHPRVLEAFEQFVKHKQELLSLLEETAERDNQLLQMMRAQSQES